MTDYSQLIAQAGQAYNVDPLLAQAVLTRESGGDPGAMSPKGATGLMQLMPATAKDMGVTNINDPAQNIMGGVKYLGQMLDKYQDVPTALAAYNAGPGAVDQHGGIPPFPETQNYVKAVTSRYQSLQAKTMPQPQMPGLPPSAPDQATAAAVDPFAGLPAAQGAPAPAAAAMVDPFAGLPTGKPAAPAPGAPATPAAPTATPWDQAMRQVGLTARAGITGLSSLPAMVGDALNSGINLGIKGVNSVAGTHISPLQMPSQVVQNAMNAAGVPQPQNATERVVQDAAGAMAGVSPFVGAGKVIAGMASPVAQAVGSGMQVLPGMQVAGSAGAGAGGGIARENGAGAVGQLGAGLLGGLAGAGAPSAALAGVRGVSGMANNAAGVVQPILNPQAYVGKQLAQALGPDAAAAAENIRSAPTFVPGSLPTTAQAGANPTLVATEKSFANTNPDFKIGLAARDAENNAARWQVLSGVAQSPEALDAAKAARQAIAGPLYDDANSNTANVGRGFINFAQRPAVQQAMQNANTLAQNEGVSLKWPTPQDRAISGQALDYTNRALGDMIGAATRSGNSQQARALTDAQAYLQNWTSQYVPGIRDAAAAYAANSVPVNTMEAGQQIANSLGTRAMGTNGIAQLQLNPYRSALVQALKSQKYGIDSDALTSLQGIGQDLQRATISNSLRSPGSDTAYNLSANGWLAKQIYGQNFNGATGLGKTLGAIGATATGHPIVGLGLLTQGNKLGQMAGDRLNKQLAQLLLDPTSLLPYLDTAAQQGPQALAPSLGRNVAQGLVGVAPALRARP